jgi:hypothetical protein
LSLGSHALDRLSLGSWKGFGWRLGFQQLGFRGWRSLRGLSLRLSWSLNLRNHGRDLRLRLSLDWLNLKRLRLEPGGGLSLRLRLRQRFKRRGLRLGLELSLRLKRLRLERRWGRGLNRLNGLLFGSRQSRRVELGLGRGRGSQLGLSWELGSGRELGSWGRDLTLRLLPLGFLLRFDLLGCFGERHG